MNLQAMMDALSDSLRETRSQYHLTLGDAIKQLGQYAATEAVLFDWNGQYVDHEASYRGFYDDLALSWKLERSTVGELRERLQKALGATYEGYKGGEFVMGERTPLWAAQWGDTGRAVVGLQFSGSAIVLQTKEMD